MFYFSIFSPVIVITWKVTLASILHQSLCNQQVTPYVAYIRALVYSFEGESWISEIRYQFGEDFDELLMREIGELIEKEISVWAAKTNFKDIVAA